jgi:hypothetical protein
VRWFVLAFILLASFLSYVLRTNMSIVGPTIMNDVGFTEMQLGMVLSAFSLSYAIFQIPSGVFGGRLGSRLAVAAIAVVWGVITIAFGLVPGSDVASIGVVIAYLVVLRFLGSCFRKESQGAQHANEFTMLNLVEMGLESNVRQERLEKLAALITETAGVDEFVFQPVDSTVYGETIDILAGENRLEIGSSAMGPHVLDQAWQITDAWVGIGFGLERLLMVAENIKSMGRLGRSLGYLDGIRLNI